MSSLLGRIDEFDGTKEDWPQYVERFDHFFNADKKSAFLAVRTNYLHCCEKPRQLVSPVNQGRGLMTSWSKC